MDLLNDLLDLAKLESGNIELDCSEQDIARIIQSVIADLSVLMDKKGIEFKFQNLDPAIAVSCDSGKMSQVFRNLLANAIKFSDDSSTIELKISCGKRLQRNADSMLTIAVKDTGIGIPEDELEAIFDKFIQSSKSKTGAGGTGLGLAISREIVALHNGRIEARNNPGGGATFTVYLPLPVHLADAA